MDEFPGNSQSKKKAEKKPEPKKVTKVVEGEVVRRKKPLGKRFAETFVGGDTRGVWNYITMDVLIPAAKDAVSDAVSQGIERMLFGEVRGGRSHRRPGSGYVSYNRMSTGSHLGRREEPRHQMSRRGRATHDFDEIILETRVEAEEVIDNLFNLVSKYEVATVADLYELVGITGNYTDDKWGWTDLRGAGATRIRNGYLLELPRPEPLD